MPDGAGYPWRTDVIGSPDMAGFHPKQVFTKKRQPDMGGFPTAPHICVGGPNWTQSGQVVNTGGANSSRRVLSLPGVCIAYGSFSTDSANVARTTDGQTWTQIAVGAGAQSWSAATYMPDYGDLGRVILIAGQGAAASNVYAYSDDLGLTWVVGTMPVSAQWVDMKYGDGVVIAVEGGSASSSVAYYTLDGITWVSTPLPLVRPWASLAYSPELRLWLVIPVSVGTTVYSRNGGQTWEQGTSSIQNIQGIRTGFVSLIWASRPDGPGMFIYPSNNPSAFFYYSTDGFNWQSTPRINGLVGSNTWGEIFVGDGIMISTAQGNDNLAISTDGVGWLNYPAKLLFAGNSRQFGLVNPGVWVAINFSSTVAFYGQC